MNSFSNVAGHVPSFSAEVSPLALRSGSVDTVQQVDNLKSTLALHETYRSAMAVLAQQAGLVGPADTVLRGSCFGGISSVDEEHLRTLIDLIVTPQPQYGAQELLTCYRDALAENLGKGSCCRRHTQRVHEHLDRVLQNDPDNEKTAANKTHVTGRSGALQIWMPGQ